jgi:hypothetical protein
MSNSGFCVWSSSFPDWTQSYFHSLTFSGSYHDYVLVLVLLFSLKAPAVLCESMETEEAQSGEWRCGIELLLAYRLLYRLLYRPFERISNGTTE